MLAQCGSCSVAGLAIQRSPVAVCPQSGHEWKTGALLLHLSAASHQSSFRSDVTRLLAAFHLTIMAPLQGFQNLQRSSTPSSGQNDQEMAGINPVESTATA